MNAVRRSSFLIAVLMLWAGCSSSPGGPSGQAGAAGAGGSAGGQATGGAGAGGSGGFPACQPVMSGVQLGIVSVSGDMYPAYGQWDGTITTLERERMIVTSGSDSIVLTWRGPDLAEAFARGDAVQVVGRARLAAFGSGGWSIVRSARATAGFLDGIPYQAVLTSPGSTVVTTVPAQFPTIVHTLVSCCSTSSPLPGNLCSFADLTASYGGSTLQIGRGATGVLGAWRVTNVDATYASNGELIWHPQVTFLGPATPRAKPPGDIAEPI